MYVNDKSIDRFHDYCRVCCFCLFVRWNNNCALELFSLYFVRFVFWLFFLPLFRSINFFSVRLKLSNSFWIFCAFVKVKLNCSLCLCRSALVKSFSSYFVCLLSNLFRNFQYHRAVKRKQTEIFQKILFTNEIKTRNSQSLLGLVWNGEWSRFFAYRFSQFVWVHSKRWKQLSIFP